MNNIKLNKTDIYRVDLYVSLKGLPALHNFENRHIIIIIWVHKHNSDFLPAKSV